MGFITQALVANTTNTVSGSLTWNPTTRNVIDTDPTTSWEAGTYTSIQFIYTATQSPTNLNGVIFNECIFTPDNVIGLRFSGALSTFNNCVFQFSGTGDATAASLFGNFEGSQGSVLSGCTWLTFGEFNSLPRQWSIALQSVDATVTNPSFSNSFLTDVSTGAVNFGWAHDATIRANADFVQRFSIRNQQASQAWSAYVQGSFADGNYTIDETDANAGSHYSSGSGGNRIVYTINQTFADWDTSTEGQETYVISATAAANAAVFNDGYAWNPRFIQSGTADTIISDASILSIPAGVDAFTLDLDNFDQGVALPSFTGGAWSGNEGNVLFMRSGTGTSSATVLTTVDKALNEDGTLNADYVVSPRVKSYTHLASTVTSELDLFESYSGGVEGTFVMAESSDVFFPLDVNLNNVILPLNSSTAAGASVPSSGNMYPAIKGVWYYGSLDEDFEPRVVNGVFTTGKTLALGSTNTYTGAALTLNTTAVLSSSNNVTGISATTIDIGGTGFNGMTINGETTGDFGAITNGSNINITNISATTVGSIENSTFSSAGNITLNGNVTESNVSSIGDIILSSSTECSDTTMMAGDINDVTLTSFTSGMTFGNGNIRFALVTAGQTTTLDDLLGTGWSFENNGQVTLHSDVAVNVTVDADDVTMLGLAIVPGTPFVRNLITYNFAEESFNVRPAGYIQNDTNALDYAGSINARGGYFSIKSGSTTILPRVDIDSSTTLADVTIEKGTTDNSTWTAYYKPATGWGAGRTAYNFTIDSFGAIDSDRTIPVSEIADVLVAGSTVEPTLGHGAYSQTGAGTTTTFRIGVDAVPGSAGGDGNMLNSGATQALCLEAANSLAYFDVHFSNNRTEQLFSPDINNGSTWLTEDEVLFVSSDTDTNPAQQIISQAVGAGAGGSLPTQNPNGYPEVLAIAEASASIPTVQAALDLSLIEIKENHQVLLTATQRGAVKAATYSAGDLNV